jgi:hypothetical protein
MKKRAGLQLFAKVIAILHRRKSEPTLQASTDPDSSLKIAFG